VILWTDISAARIFGLFEVIDINGEVSLQIKPYVPTGVELCDFNRALIRIHLSRQQHNHGPFITSCSPPSLLLSTYAMPVIKGHLQHAGIVSGGDAFVESGLPSWGEETKGLSTLINCDKGILPEVHRLIDCLRVQVRQTSYRDDRRKEQRRYLRGQKRIPWLAIGQCISD
jgi:hypothetical protein